MFAVYPALIILVLAASPAAATCDDYSLSGEASPKFTDGKITAISATGVSSIVGENPTGISIAMKSAGLKARGALVRYMSQDVTSEQLVESMSSSQVVSQNDLNSAIQKNAERTAEIIRSRSDDILKGVTNVSECYDASRNLAFVKVGVAESLMQALGNFGKLEHQKERSKSESSSSNGNSTSSFEHKSKDASLFE